MKTKRDRLREIKSHLAQLDPIVRGTDVTNCKTFECGCCHRTFDTNAQAADSDEHMVSCVWRLARELR